MSSIYTNSLAKWVTQVLHLNTMIEQNTPQNIEQQLIKKYLTFAKQKGVSESTAHKSLIWVLKLMRFHNGAHPGDLNQHDVASYLSALAIEQYVSISTQQLALSAISSFYREFIHIDLKLKHFIKSKSRRGFSDKFSASECQSIIQNLNGPSQLMAKLAYHCQLRLYQVANLKVSDIDLKSGTLSIFDKNDSLKFKAAIPLSLQLDLRIQKMRACQLNKQLKRLINLRSLSDSTDDNPTQIRLFKEHNCLLFILSDIKCLTNLEIQNQINPEVQLAILKSEIKVALKRTRLFSSLNKNIRFYNKTTPILKQSNSLHVQTSRLPTDLVANPQKDFFDLGAA